MGSPSGLDATPSRQAISDKVYIKACSIMVCNGLKVCGVRSGDEVAKCSTRRFLPTSETTHSRRLLHFYDMYISQSFIDRHTLHGLDRGDLWMCRVPGQKSKGIGRSKASFLHHSETQCMCAHHSRALFQSRTTVVRRNDGPSQNTTVVYSCLMSLASKAIRNIYALPYVVFLPIPATRLVSTRNIRLDHFV